MDGIIPSVPYDCFIKCKIDERRLAQLTMNTATAPRCVRILIVEDNPAYVYLIRETLQQNELHFELDVAEDGAEAIAFLDRAEQQSGRCPDLILLDLNLPKRDGNEVMSRIKQSVKC